MQHSIKGVASLFTHLEKIIQNVSKFAIVLIVSILNYQRSFLVAYNIFVVSLP